MAQFPRPEILRVPLESICLAVKATREHEDVKVSDFDEVATALVLIVSPSNFYAGLSTHQMLRLWTRRFLFSRNLVPSIRMAV